eukprot:GHVT01086473.1.p1 GENE.GHVT01086473.1~~GHVT01086473.1.p1  ORF type:complete len:146 (-),score=44.12 GHVT01086473.1:951-1367(-)
MHGADSRSASPSLSKPPTDDVTAASADRRPRGLAQAHSEAAASVGGANGNSEPFPAPPPAAAAVDGQQVFHPLKSHRSYCPYANERLYGPPSQVAILLRELQRKQLTHRLLANATKDAVQTTTTGSPAVAKPTDPSCR